MEPRVSKSGGIDLPWVEVVVFTFNHEKYIVQALQSVLAQTYPGALSIRIHDDCSSDETVALAQKVAATSNIPISIYVPKENRYSTGIGFISDFISTSKARYVAILSGDDFWTDPTKLSRQVSLMELHPTVALSHHRFSRLEPSNKLRKSRLAFNLQRTLLKGSTLKHFNFIGALTVVIKMEYFPKAMPPGFNELSIDDWPMWALTTRGKKIALVNRFMASYRVHANNAWANLGSQEQYRANSLAKRWIEQNISGGQRHSESGHTRWTGASRLKSLVYKLAQLVLSVPLAPNARYIFWRDNRR